MSLPADDTTRAMVHARPDDPELRRTAVVGDIYTVLVSGEQTAGRYCLIDMVIPPAGGPPPHRHDFEEMFTLLEGAVEFTFRGEKVVVKAGETVNIPANAPHNFHNPFDQTARMLCMCSPAGMDEFFLRIGDPVDSRTAQPPKLTGAQLKERGERAVALAAEYRSEILAP